MNRTTLLAEKRTLEERLTRGWNVIDAQIAANGPRLTREQRLQISALETHWLALLRRYTAVCDLLMADCMVGGSPCPS